MSVRAGIHEKGTFSLSQMIDDMKNQQASPKAGAIALFVGIVRGETVKGRKVQKLELEAYEEKANEVLKSICQDLKRKSGIVDVQIHHLLGEFDVGDDLVYVGVSGAHRKHVFPVLEEAVERFKKEVPIFKKEHVAGQKGRRTAYWVSEHERTS